MSSGQRNALLGVVAVAALAGAGTLFFRAAKSTSLPETFSVTGVCLSCKEESQTTHKLGERDPFECPKCHKTSVYTWSFCMDCQKRFVPNLERQVPGEPLRIPMPIRCPACGGTNVSVYQPGYIDAADIKGDLALPKWEP